MDSSETTLDLQTRTVNIRRSGAKYFLEGLQDEEIRNAMDDLLVYLETCPSEETPLVAVLLLHLDLLVRFV